MEKDGEFHGKYMLKLTTFSYPWRVWKTTKSVICYISLLHNVINDGRCATCYLSAVGHVFDHHNNANCVQNLCFFQFQVPCDDGGRLQTVG